MRRLAFLLVIPALLAGCSSGSASSAAPTPSPTLDHEAEFVARFHQEGKDSVVNTSDERMLQIAYATCKVLRNGQVGEGELIDWGLAQYPNDADALVAVTFANHLCPDWAKES